MSVDALKQILNDKSLADNFVVTLANGQTYQLGDLRALSRQPIKPPSLTRGKGC